MAKKNLKQKQPEKNLPLEVAEKYRLKTIRPGKYNFQGFGEMDLRTLTLKQADELAEKEFPFLELKKKPEPEEPEE